MTSQLRFCNLCSEFVYGCALFSSTVVVGATMTRLRDLAIFSFLNLLSIITSENYIQYVGK